MKPEHTQNIAIPGGIRIRSDGTAAGTLVTTASGELLTHIRRLTFDPIEPGGLVWAHLEILTTADMVAQQPEQPELAPPTLYERAAAFLCLQGSASMRLVQSHLGVDESAARDLVAQMVDDGLASPKWAKRGRAVLRGPGELLRVGVDKAAGPDQSVITLAVHADVGDALAQLQDVYAKAAQATAQMSALLEGMTDVSDALDTLQAYEESKAIPVKPHMDDVAVDLFAADMKAKLAEKRAQGYEGWGDSALCSADRLRCLLRDAVAKGDPVDVANYAMMAWARGEITGPAAEQGIVAYRVESRAGNHSFMEAKHWRPNLEHCKGARVHSLILGQEVQA
jgi:hypothetical protein